MRRTAGNIRIFDRLVFGGLCFLVGLLLVLPLLLHLFPGMRKETLADFENEIGGLAWFASRNQHYEQEIAYYHALMEKIPETKPEIFPKIGKAWANLGKPLKAMEFFNKSLEAGTPDSAAIFYEVALVAHHMKRYDMAEKYYKKSCSDSVFLSGAHFNLGNIRFFVRKNNEQALMHYLRAVEEPAVERLYKEMLRRELKIYNERHEPEVYQRLYSRYTGEKSSPDFSRFDKQTLLANAWGENQAIIHNYIGTIYAMKEDNQQALKYFRKALEIDPGFEDARFNIEKLIQF